MFNSKIIFIMNRLLIFSVFIIGFVSCGEDFLNEPPKSVLTVGTFPSTESDAILATNAIYFIAKTWSINTGGFPVLDVMSDETVKGSNPGDGIHLRPYETFEHEATSIITENWYKTVYSAIKKTNLVIEKVPSIENIDPNLQSRLVAEARAFRAYFYSLLVRGYGDVPKVTVSEPPLGLGRAPYQEILNEIIYPDYEYAIANLPKRSDYPAEDLGRMTKGAAEGLYARIKLFYGDFETVETLTESIIESKEYELVPTLGKIFSHDNEFNEESIFEIGGLATTNQVLGGNQYANTQGVRGTPNKGWGFSRPAYPFIQELEANQDPRMESSILFLNEVIDGQTIVGEAATPDTTMENGRIVEIECYNQKVWVPGPTSETSFSHNRRILRYADVLLMHAEALVENGKASDALPFINQIRARARGGSNVLPDITTTNPSELKEAILNERKYELAFEGLRFWDLIRTGKAIEVMGPLGFVAGKNEFLPLPQSEIDISQGLILQNPGY